MDGYQIAERPRYFLLGDEPVQQPSQRRAPHSIGKFTLVFKKGEHKPGSGALRDALCQNVNQHGAQQIPKRRFPQT